LGLFSDANEAEVTHEVDALMARSRSGLGWLEAFRPRASGSTPLRCPRSGGTADARAVARPLACSRERTSKEGFSVEVKIGVTDSPRELVLQSAQTPSEVEDLVTAALGKESGVLALTDEKGRRFLVQNTRIAYVEIGEADHRRVGFGIGATAAAVADKLS
jgi:predicted membrane-bound mannosyltransferase